MNLAALALLAACADAPERPAPRAVGSVAAPPDLAVVVSVPRLREGLRPVADLLEDLSPVPLALSDGRDAAVSLAALGPDAFDRLDPDAPAFALFFGAADPPVWVLPLRSGAPLEAPPHGFARVRGRTALVSESGALLDQAEAYAVRTLARRRPDALSIEVLPGAGRARRLREIESSLAAIARDLEASARAARAEAGAPPTLGDPEAVGPLVEDLARDALAAVGDATLSLRLEGGEDGVRLEARMSAPVGPAPATIPPAPPDLPGAVVRFSSVTAEADRVASSERLLGAFERIAGGRVPQTERASLRAAFEAFDRARADASSWSVGADGAGATFACRTDCADTLVAARGLAAALGRGHAAVVLSAVGFEPVAADAIENAVRLRFGRASLGAGAASDWPAGTALRANVDPVRALSLLGPMGGERMAALGSAADAAPAVPPLALSVRREDDAWAASLLVPRASAREVGRVLRRALARD